MKVRRLTRSLSRATSFPGMKIITALTSCAVLAMVSCENMNGVGSSGGFDPLQAPGAQLAGENTGGLQRIRPGEFVVAAIDNTAFYNERPGLEAEADKLLKRGTSMKVISTSGSFLRVELDSGEVGFVPGVMAESANAMPDDPADAFNPMEVDPVGQPEPYVPLPGGLPNETLPDVIEPELPTPAPAPAPAPASPDAPTPDI